jgi:hypothetical protein
MVEVAWRGAGCVAALLATTAVRAQTVETFDGSAAATFACPAGTTTTFGVFGTPNAPFATLASPVQIEVATPYGTLRAAPGVDGAALVYDGFDPTHPRFNASRFGPTGTFAQAVQPFQYGADYFAAYAVQTIAADPASPFGFSLSNAVQLAFVPPQPEVYDVSPNLALPGQLVVVSGSHFVADVYGQSVTVGGLPCVVVASSHDELTAIVPAGATSGHVVVAHAGGGSAPADALGAWLAVTPGAPVAPAGVGAAPPASLQTVVGNLGAGQVAAFPLHLEPGQQVSAELYPWNPLTERIEFAPPTPTTPVADPVLKVQIFPTAPLTVATDDNAGPATCAAFGPASTGVHFVADQPVDLMIEVSYKNPQSAGWFALVYGAVSAAGLPVTLQRLDPEMVAPGGVLHVFGTSFDPEEPEGHAVLLGGVAIEPFEITPTRMSVFVPLDARSGPVGLLTPTAAVAPRLGAHRRVARRHAGPPDRRSRRDADDDRRPVLRLRHAGGGRGSRRLLRQSDRRAEAVDRALRLRLRSGRRAEFVVVLRAGRRPGVPHHARDRDLPALPVGMERGPRRERDERQRLGDVRVHGARDRVLPHQDQLRVLGVVGRIRDGPELRPVNRGGRT